jgi:mannose-6-phosphate isomerase-like protein (cupin superfamily)
MSRELEQRIRAVEDRLAIAQVRARYCHLADERRWEALAELFAEDAEFVALSRSHGRAAILAYLSGLEQAMDEWWHMTHNETLELDGDRASGQAYFDAPCVIGGVPHLCAGRYDDEFVRRDDRWLFVRRAMTFFYLTPLQDGWREGAVPEGLPTRAAPAPSTESPEETPVSETTETAGAAIDIEQVRRVVTGLDGDGRSTVLFDGASPHLRTLPDYPTFRFTDLWVAKTGPADNRGSADDADGPVAHTPPAGGNVFRVLEIAPDPPGVDMAEVGMHVTPTVDYVYVLSGEITCVLEEGEVHLTPGDVLIQRGTIHAWSNRGSVPCVMLGVLVDAVNP